MPLTVFAEGRGLFHKGSNGKGVATGDVCLSPAPAGPVAVPYVNTLVASNLARGSKSVRIDGQETALEAASYVASSSGDEAGSQGGNVVTHKSQGRGYFKTWSFTVRIEGQGVCRHGDMLGHNCMSTPAGSVDMKALTQFVIAPEARHRPCDRPFESSARCGPDDRQLESVRSGPCWECAREVPERRSARAARSADRGTPYTSVRRDVRPFAADHQPPLNVAWYQGACHLPAGEFERWATSTAAVRPHCAAHAMSQGGTPALTGKAARDTCDAFLWGAE